MDLIAKVACSGCSAVIELTVRSAEHAEEELAAAGWTACSGGDNRLCSRCSKPSVEPTSTPRETKPSGYAWSAAQLEPILREGKFTHESGGDIWRTGPDFCWLESMPARSGPKTPRCASGSTMRWAERSGKPTAWAYTTLDRVHHCEGLGRLSSGPPTRQVAYGTSGQRRCASQAVQMAGLARWSRSATAATPRNSSVSRDTGRWRWSRGRRAGGISSHSDQKHARTTGWRKQLRPA